MRMTGSLKAGECLALFTSLCIILTVIGSRWGRAEGGYALESSRPVVVLVVQVREKDGLNQDDGGGAGEQQLELGPGLEVEPIKQ